jgi:hypothetical protein
MILFSQKTAFKHKSQQNVLDYSKLPVTEFKAVNPRLFHIEMFSMVEP